MLPAQAIGSAGSSFVNFFASIDRRLEDAGLFKKLERASVPNEVRCVCCYADACSARQRCGAWPLPGLQEHGHQVVSCSVLCVNTLNM